MTERATTPSSSGTADGVLDLLEEIAKVEHSMLAEYLEVSYVMGRRLDDTSTVLPAVQVAAGQTFDLAQMEMRHLSAVNVVLVKAGRPPQVGRAAQIAGPGASTIAFGPLGPTELGHLAEREDALAAALDAAYARVAASVAAEPPPLGDEVLAALDFVLMSADHQQRVRDNLTGPLAELKRSDYLLVTRHAPESALERAMLDVGRQHYDVVVSMARARFSDEELNGLLFGTHQSWMQALDDYNALIVSRGLLPALGR